MTFFDFLHWSGLALLWIGIYLNWKSYKKWQEMHKEIRERREFYLHARNKYEELIAKLERHYSEECKEFLKDE